jgi:DNA invertase Pin-like site-specific DNA recombinase
VRTRQPSLLKVFSKAALSYVGLGGSGLLAQTPYFALVAKRTISSKEFSARWIPGPASLDPRDRLLAARALVGVLLDSPQQSPDVRAASLPPGGPLYKSSSAPAQSPAPLDYRETGRFSPLGALGRSGSDAKIALLGAPRPGYAGPRIRETKGAARPNNRAKRSCARLRSTDSKGMAERAKSEGLGQQPKQRRRPGEGGRRQGSANSDAGATARLEAKLGPPDQVIEGPGPARTMVWTVNSRPWIDPSGLNGGPAQSAVGGAATVLAGSEAPEVGALSTPASNATPGSEASAPGAPPDPRALAAALAEEPAAEEPAARGAGIIVGRLSSREMQNGETVLGQILDCWQMAKQHHLPVSEIIVCTNYKSELGYSERPDFQRILDKIAIGECHWVGFREPDRVARKIVVSFSLYEELQQQGVELWLPQLGRPVDWENDSDTMLMALQQGMGQQQRTNLVAKLQKAKRRTWLEEGRGWPGAIRFGFRRRKSDRYLEVDPEQWPIVKLIHYRYATAKSGRKTGCAAITEILAEQGVDLSPARIRTMLQDPIYVDGTYTVNDAGQAVACEPIPLDDPIPLNVFQRNQEVLACQKGPNSKTPIGAFCLNGIKVRHAECQHEVNERYKNGPLIKGRNFNGDRMAYYHSPWTPKTCRGYVIERTELEAPVFKALIELAEDPDLQAAWAAAARVVPAPARPILDAAQQTRLREELANLSRAQAELTEEITTKMRRGETVGAGQRGLLDGLSEEITQTEKRLEAAQLDEVPEHARRQPLRSASRDQLLAALKEICTAQVPDDPRMMLRRTAVIECCLSEIIIHDCDDGQFELELRGPLAPLEAIENDEALPIDPLDAAGHVLEDLVDEQAGVSANGIGDLPPEAVVHAPLPNDQDRAAIRSRTLIPNGRSLLARRYEYCSEWSEVRERLRRAERKKDPWPRRWWQYRQPRDRCTVWISSEHVQGGVLLGRFTEAERVAALRAAAAAFPDNVVGEKIYQSFLNLTAWQAVGRARREDDREIQALGLDDSGSAPGEGQDEQTDPAGLSSGGVKAHQQLGSPRVGSGERRLDLPSVHDLVHNAKRQGLTFPQWRDKNLIPVDDAG